MMRKVAASFCVVAMATVSAEAGIVTFTPRSEISLPRDAVEFDVSVSADLATYDAIGMLFQTNLQNRPLSFQFASVFAPGPCDTCVTVPAQDPIPYQIFGMDLFVGGNRFAAPAWGTTEPILVGRLTVDTAGLPAGTELTVSVDAAAELASPFETVLSSVVLGQGIPEALNGSFVVPEPATLSLLGLGLLGFVRRRLA